jgi:hypothetical protein
MLDTCKIHGIVIEINRSSFADFLNKPIQEEKNNRIKFQYHEEFILHHRRADGHSDRHGQPAA